MSRQEPDVSQLSLNGPSTVNRSHRPKRGRSSMVIVVIVISMVLLFGYVGRDALLPPAEVSVVRALAIKSTGTAIAEGELSFQSAGWVEPAPFPIKATALVSGVVKSIRIIEGSRVKKGELIAELIERDLQLDLEGIDAEEKQLKLALKEIDSEILMARAAVHHHDVRIITEKKKLKKLVSLAETYEKSEGGVSKLDVIKATQDVSIQKSIVDERVAEGAILMASAALSKAKRETRETALAVIANRRAKVTLALERTKIYSPADGVVLRMFARTGSRMNLNSSSDDAATVAELYEMESLQVRVDVPLADAGRLSVGQKAEIRVEILPDREFSGVVTSIVGRADVTRNTLQAKVKIIDPDEKLRPEMLAKVKFLSMGPMATDAASLNAERVRLFISEDSVTSEGEVWVVDRVSKTLSSRAVTLGREKRNGWVEVISGVKAGQQLVVGDMSALSDGMRVKTKLIETEEKR